MTLAIVSCMASLSWAFLLLLLITYVFSILFVQAATSHVDSDGSEAEGIEGIQDMYGSLTGTMYTMIQAISGGNDWGALAEPLHSISPLYTLIFMLYVLFVTFGVMNVLTGVFLESSGEIMDRDLVMQAEVARKETFSREMHKMFELVDTDRSGRINWDEFHAALKDSNVQAFFTSLELDTIDAHVLFTLIAKNEVEVDVHDFIMGCWRMTGAARTMHFNIVERDAELWQEELNTHVHSIQGQLQGILDAVRRPSTRSH